MKTAVVIAGMFGAILIGHAPTASAAPLCEHRSSAHIAEHGGQLEDDRYHVSRGELPNCDSEGSQSSSGGSSSNDNDSDDKSRYCRRHFFC